MLAARLDFANPFAGAKFGSSMNIRRKGSFTLDYRTVTLVAAIPAS